MRRVVIVAWILDMSKGAHNVKTSDKEMLRETDRERERERERERLKWKVKVKKDNSGAFVQN